MLMILVHTGATVATASVPTAANLPDLSQYDVAMTPTHHVAPSTVSTPKKRVKADSPPSSPPSAMQVAKLEYELACAKAEHIEKNLALARTFLGQDG